MRDLVLHHQNHGISVYQELNSTLPFTSAEHFPAAQLWRFNLSFCFALKKVKQTAQVIKDVNLTPCDYITM